ncbi:MAG: protease pro-enzyme activation domain-containing protein [Candidatus Sulfotelmatobacter sp.]
MRNTRHIRSGLFSSLLTIIVFSLLPQSLLAAPAASQHTAAVSTGPRVTQAIDESQLTTLGRNTRPEANRANDRGALPEGYGVEHMLLLLQRSPQQEQALDKFIDSLNDKKSANFHHWLTAEEFGAKYGVAQEDIDTVTKWLESHGFQVNKVYASQIMIDFSGAAGQIKQAFHTELHALDVNGEAHISNMNDPQIPAALAPVVKGIASLNDFKPHPTYKSAVDYTFSGCASSAAVPSEPGTCYAITPQDNAAIYNLNPLFSAGISGQGQTIALVEDTDTYGGAADWNTYRSTFGLATSFPAGTYTQVHPGGCTDPGTNADDGEAAIDVEVASAIAPSAAIELISCSSGTVTFGGLLAMQNLVNGAGPYPGVVSVSYGVCEALNGNGGNAAFYNTYQQAASEGISVFVSSGDDGPSSCANEFGQEYDIPGQGVTGWGESPYNVSVGGTDFEDVYNSKTGQNGGAPLSTYWSQTNPTNPPYGSALSYIPEMPWDDACANSLISFVATGSFTAYGASPATCNNATFDVTTSYLSLGAGSGGPSNCATGEEGTNSQTSAIVSPQCQGYPKPSYQTGAALTGGQAVYGQPSDGVRDIPDVSMFAANGVWGHFETVCWSDPTQTSGGAASCAGAPSTWSGFGGTSVATPTMAAIQALVNQKTAQSWGNPNPIYYQIAQNQYGVAGGTFNGSGCNSSTGNTAGCAFNDVTQGDIDLACEADGTLQKAHCYLPAGTRGVTSTNNITAGTVLVGGSGYTTAPTCTIAGPSNNNPYLSPTGTTLWAGGTQATCTATVSTATNTAKWTVAMQTAADAFGQQIIVGSQTYTVASSGTTTALATALAAAINANNTVATATSSTKTVTITAKVAGAAGNFSVSYGTAEEFNNFGIAITNTVLGEGPNYVSGITITNAGSGYQPETPITLGGPGTGAVAVANTVFSTAAQSYQPSWGAAPGYDLATGLGTPNAKALVCSTAWGSSCVTASFTLTANPTSGSVVQGSNTTSTITVVPAGGFNGSVTLSATNLPSGVTASFSPNPTTTTSTMTLTANGGATVGGPTTVAVNGVSGSLNSSTNYGLTVTAGTPGIYSPANGSTLSVSGSANFQWVGASGATAYWLDVGAAQGSNSYYSSGSLSATTFSQNVTSLPTNGTAVWARWYYLVSGTWQFIDYSYTAFGGSSGTGMITSPAPNSNLTGSTVTFSWSAGSSATAYWLDAGSSAGAHDYYSSGNLGTALTTTVSGLPTNGSTVYVTLYSLVSGTWVGNPYTYTAYNLAASGGMMSSPTPGSTFTSSSVTFTWTAGSGASGYWIDIGSTAGGHDIYSSGNLGNMLTTTVSGLPTDGSQIYVTLYTLIGSTWSGNAYTYFALNATSGIAQMTSPSNNATLSGNSVTFTWSSDANATGYWVDVSLVGPGGNDLDSSGNLGTALTETINNLPANGSTVYVTLYSLVGGQWLSSATTYTSGP